MQVELVSSFRQGLEVLRHNLDALRSVEYLAPALALGMVLLILFAGRKTTQREKLSGVLNLFDRFNSEPMLSHRADAARGLMAGHRESNPAVDAVLEFFDELGDLLRCGAVDVKAIDGFLGEWVEAYCCATAGYRLQHQWRRVWPDFAAGCERIRRGRGRRGRKLWDLRALRPWDALDEAGRNVLERDIGCRGCA